MNHARRGSCPRCGTDGHFLGPDFSPAHPIQETILGTFNTAPPGRFRCRACRHE